jgi:hypothetical protein
MRDRHRGTKVPIAGIIHFSTMYCGLCLGPEMSLRTTRDCCSSIMAFAQTSNRLLIDVVVPLRDNLPTGAISSWLSFRIWLANYDPAICAFPVPRALPTRVSSCCPGKNVKNFSLLICRTTASAGRVSSRRRASLKRKSPTSWRRPSRLARAQRAALGFSNTSMRRLLCIIPEARLSWVASHEAIQYGAMKQT